MKMKHIAILAGDFHEFKKFQYETTLPEDTKIHYFDGGDSFRGYEFQTYIIIGTFNYRTNHKEILEEVKVRTRP
jgi:hypothetical protein